MSARWKTQKLDAEALWEYALRALGRRAHSANELRAKLARRAGQQADVDTAMAKLREYALVDDAKFSEAFATSRLQNDGFGRLRVLRDLRAKRVASAVADEAVQKTFSGIEESELIEQYLARKYRNIDLAQYLKEERNLANAYRRLVMAGFNARTCLTILKRYSSAAEGLEEPPEETEFG